MNKALINLAIISSIVSVIIVSTIDISWKVYGAVFFTQLILVIVNFSFSKNKNLFKNLWIINLIFFISYNIRISRRNYRLLRCRCHRRKYIAHFLGNLSCHYCTCATGGF
ncbi:hypothetical protein [Lysinibacillus sp. FSL K6-4013]|uniref:hypothetical protein n=1 Tax=Lysinibacillus sp. FSL K6-4013 TaxID=2921504 RepID=UPI00315AD111